MSLSARDFPGNFPALEKAHQERLDELLIQVRENQEKHLGPRYWERPRITTGPVDPWPGHSWNCWVRRGQQNCDCSGGFKMFGVTGKRLRDEYGRRL